MGDLPLTWPILLWLLACIAVQSLLTFRSGGEGCQCRLAFFPSRGQCLLKNCSSGYTFLSGPGCRRSASPRAVFTNDPLSSEHVYPARVHRLSRLLLTGRYSRQHSTRKFHRPYQFFAYAARQGGSLRPGLIQACYHLWCYILLIGRSGPLGFPLGWLPDMLP